MKVNFVAPMACSAWGNISSILMGSFLLFSFSCVQPLVGVGDKRVCGTHGEKLRLTSVAMASILPCISSCASKPACEVVGKRE